MSGVAPRQSLVEAFARAVASFDLGARVARAVARESAGARRVCVIALGKAAGPMCDAALSVVRARATHVLCILPDGAAPPRCPRAEVVRAAHPLPDQRSVAAAARALTLARGDHDAVLLLVSGGASSLACAPRGVSLAEKTEIGRAMLLGGAPIASINVVRRHLSRIKGGWLARVAAPAQVVSIIASDVLDGGPHDVGSGPGVLDPTTVDQARRALARYAPAARVELAETPKPWGPAARRVRVRVVASPLDLARLVGRELDRRGFDVRLLPPATGDVLDVAVRVRELARALAPGEAVVRAAEPTLHVDAEAPGRGGRSGHLAALVARDLPADVAFLAGASDGVDGSSGAAGACVDASSFARFESAAIDGALRRFDSATLHERAGTRIAIGPTGQNLADVHVVARWSESTTAQGALGAGSSIARST